MMRTTQAFHVGDQVRLTRDTGEFAGQRGQIRAISLDEIDLSYVYTVFLKIGAYVTVPAAQLWKV